MDKTTYLLSYNLLSLIFWSAILGRLILLIFLVGPPNIYGGLGDLTRYTQTLAILEIIHAGLGIVRAPVVTTVLQVGSRLVLVWGVAWPDTLLWISEGRGRGREVETTTTTETSWYASMVLAWSVTEVVRYAFFVFVLRAQSQAQQKQRQRRTTRSSSSNSSKGTTTNGDANANPKAGGPAGVPDFLVWLRYNTFYPLYPLGITSECVLVWKAYTFASQTASTSTSPTNLFGTGTRGWESRAWMYGWIYLIILLVYVPGSWVLYTHMMAQRRRVMRG